jgi:hypothetical protein
VKPPLWTPEKLAALDSVRLAQLRANALARSHPEVAQLCEDEVARRRASKPVRGRKQPSAAQQGTVRGYHFVCQNDRGVALNSDGTFWSGSWVVAEAHAEKSLSAGAYLALHSSRTEPSYGQGQIIGFRTAPRSMIAKHNEGIEFHVRPESSPYAWTGDGTGEKGYNWGPQLDPSETKNSKSLEQ